MKDQLKWDRRYLDLAKLISTWSKDPSTKTGCVIVSNNRVISVGFNGFPDKVEDAPHHYEDRNRKLMLIEHCERNSIYSAARNGVKLVGSTMYLTDAPCHDCTRGIIQVGIVRVVWPRINNIESSGRWTESVEYAELIMDEAGVRYDRVEYGGENE